MGSKLASEPSRGLFIRSRRGGAISGVLLACSLLWPGWAQGDPLTLLKIEGISQGVGTSYQFLNNSVGSQGSLSSTHHDFIEDYTISSDFSILSRHLIRGSASLDFWADQQRQREQGGQNSSSSDLNIGYRISGVFLDRSPFPVTVGADSQRQTVSAPFSRSYTLDSDDLNVLLDINNRFLPLKFSVQRNSSVTSGLLDDRSQHSDYYLLDLQHLDGSLSSTALTLHQSDSQSTLLTSRNATDSAEVGGTLANTLNWQGERHLVRSLSTSYTFARTGGFFTSSSQMVSSNLSAELGKSLNATALYSYAQNDTELQGFRMQTANATISHHLAESITTSLAGSGSRTVFNDGSESSYGGSGSVSYQKKVPWDGVFSSSYTLSYTITDRDMASSVLPVGNERHDIPPLDPRRIVLANPNFLPDTVQVRGVQTLTLYSKDLDYRVIPEGILILPGRMPGDSQLYVSYSFSEAPRLSFASIGQSANARLNLFDKQLILYGDFRLTETHLLSGSASADQLAPISHLDLGVEGNGAGQSAHAEYGRDEYFDTKLDYFEARYLRQRPFASGTLALSANDHLTFYHRNVAGLGSWQNGLGANGTYSRNFGEKVTGRFMLGYLNFYQGAGSASNLFTGNLNVEAHLGKTMLSLNSSVSRGVGGGTFSQSEAVGVTFRRNF